MKNQKEVQLEKESGEVVKFDEAGMPQLEVWLEDETIWLTQKQMGELFGVKEHSITYHIQEIIKSGELEGVATTRKIRVVRFEGKRQVARQIDYYNLDMIISVGYRVNSRRGVIFRRWATGVLKEYLLRGLVRDRRIGKLEKREAGGAQVAVGWNSCGGLGGNAGFTMVSRGVSPKNLKMGGL